MTEKIVNVTTDLAVFGAVIAKLREMHEPPILQLELAKLIGLSPSAWSRVEKGETALSAAQLRVLSRIFSISTDEIFELVEEAEAGLQEKGVELKSFDFLKGVAKSASTNGLSGSTLAGLAAVGMIPIFGAALSGIVGGIVSYKSLKNKK